jgi:Peptidase MA superfamily
VKSEVGSRKSEVWGGWRALALALILAAILAPWRGQIAQAAPAPTQPHFRLPTSDFPLIEQTAKPEFPNRITFTLKAESDVEIRAAQLFYRPALAEITNLSQAEVTPGKTIDLTHEVNMQTRYLPPGLDIVYYWSLTDAQGQHHDTEPQTFLYEDGRFPWHSLTGGQVTVYYYSGNDDFGRDLLDTAQRTITKLTQRFGVAGNDPVHIVVYGSTRDFATSLPPNSAEWIGGQAHPDLGLIVTGIQPGGGAASEIRRVLPHEVSHLLLYQATKNPYGGPSHWLDEGLAVYNQETVDTSLKPLLNQAVKNGALLPVRALNSNFPLDPNEARLSYAESVSLVEFIVAKYGDAKLGELLRSFKDELSADEALQRTIGVDTDGLDAAWKASLGYGGDKAGATVGPGATNTPLDQLFPLLGVSLPIAALLLVVMGALTIRWLRGPRPIPPAPPAVAGAGSLPPANGQPWDEVGHGDD